MESLPSTLDNIVVVLWEPQDDINIGNTVRACKNFGVADLRLVRPAEADPERIAISAPKADDLIEAIETYESLEEAIADCVYVVGTTARERASRQMVTEPRGAAGTVVEYADRGPAAYVFGREDSGLPNEAIDACNSVVTIPTNPAYTSLNLGQAVLLNLWEVFRVATDQPIEQPDVASVSAEPFHEPAEMEAMERMFGMAERALEAVDFFKFDETEHIMQTLRNQWLRASLDRRDVSIWMGVFSEVLETAERAGGEESEGPDEQGDGEEA